MAAKYDHLLHICSLITYLNDLNFQNHTEDVCGHDFRTINKHGH